MCLDLPFFEEGIFTYYELFYKGREYPVYYLIQSFMFLNRIMENILVLILIRFLRKSRY